MPNWRLITDDPPHSREVLLWLRAPDGAVKPIGCLVGTYIENNAFIGWAEKSATGNPNTGLQQNLITYWSELYDGPKPAR